VHKDGVVVTNYHVIAQEKPDQLYDELYFSLPPDGGAAPSAVRRYRLKTLLINKSRDLVLLQIIPESQANASQPPVFPAVELGNSQKMELLDDLVVIGFPEKGGATVTANAGVVEGKDTREEWIKTDARLIHGNSGGAAVNIEGKLIGIPTKVEVDKDAVRSYGAVGFLRPAHLVAAMLSQWRESEQRAEVSRSSGSANRATSQMAPPPSNPSVAAPTPVTVRGVVKSAHDGKPIAGARVGLLPLGQELTASNLITWGGTNAEGQFELGKPVPPGRYTLRAKVIGYEAFSREIEISTASPPIIIELR
jgi:S1-C subfamily serine protease